MRNREQMEISRRCHPEQQHPRSRVEWILILLAWIRHAHHDILVFLFLFSLSLSANQIEWEKVNGADHYELEIIDSNENIVERVSTKETKTEIKIEKPGRYRYRIGSADNNKRVAWTNWIDFKIEILSDEKPRENITLEWELQQIADAYIIQVVDESGKTIREEKLNSTRLSLKLGVGKYKYRVASINELGKKVWSEWDQFEVKIRMVDVPYPIENTNMEAVSNQIDRIDLCSVRCNVVWRSSLLPGWGQKYRDDPNLRVYAYPILLSTLLVGYYSNHQANLSADKKYDSAFNQMLIAQADNSSMSTLLTYYSYSKLTNASSETKQTYSDGNQFALLMLGVYLFNLIDAYYFYDYTVPISERYKQPSLSFRMNNVYLTQSTAKEMQYSFSYGWSF